MRQDVLRYISLSFLIQLMVLPALCKADLRTDTAPAETAPDRKLLEIRGHLFLEGSGKLDEKNVFAADAHSWNVIDRSHAVLVLVEVAGPPWRPSTKGSVTLTAKSGRTSLGRKTFFLGDYFTESGQTLALPMLVYGAFCAPLEVKASLSTPGQKTSILRRVADFRCGE
jgi:hypothetical protein